MKTMNLNGCQAKIEYDPEKNTFRGEILGLNGTADFYGQNQQQLRAEFKKIASGFFEGMRRKSHRTQALFHYEISLARGFFCHAARSRSIQ